VKYKTGTLIPKYRGNGEEKTRSHNDFLHVLVAKLYTQKQASVSILRYVVVSKQRKKTKV
jgi:hypothetical protein